LRNDGFVSGVLTGVALGALMVVALSPDTRRPIMQGANQLGGQMRKLMRRGTQQMAEMMPGDLT
jgi:gas vesicle protein